MSITSPNILRLVTAAVMGTALVASGLQPVYEILNPGWIIYIPKWWGFLNFMALSALVVVAFALRRRERRLFAIVCFVFAVCVLVSLKEGLHGFHVIPTEQP
jgi:hypothetical protein